MSCHCRERSDHSQHSNHLGTSEIRHASDRRIHYSLRTEFPDGHFQDRLHQIHHGVSFRTIYQRSDIQGSYRVMSCIRHILFHETLSSRIHLIVPARIRFVLSADDSHHLQHRNLCIRKTNHSQCDKIQITPHYAST